MGPWATARLLTAGLCRCLEESGGRRVRWDYHWRAHLEGKLVLYWLSDRDDEKLSFWKIELQVTFFHPCCDVHQVVLRSEQVLLDHLVEIRGRATCHQHCNVRKTMCLNDGSQWWSVNREVEGAKNWSLMNLNDQLMWFGNLWKPFKSLMKITNVTNKCTFNKCNKKLCSFNLSPLKNLKNILSSF